MKKTVLAFGLDLPSVAGFDVVRLDSDRSFLDADIVVAELALDQFQDEYGEGYGGLTKLSKHGSYQFQQAKQRWTSGIRAALSAGKTVVIFLTERQQRYYYTGGQSVSGTGRNAQVTNHVALCSNYDFLPSSLPSPTYNRGTSIKIADRADLLLNYWKQFGSVSQYNVFFEAGLGKQLLQTTSGEKVVGCLQQRQEGGGLILLPELVWGQEFLATYLSNDERKVAGKPTKVGSDAAQFTALSRFTVSLRDALVELDQSLRGDFSETAPGWVDDPKYRLNIEGEVEDKIIALGEQLSELEVQRNELVGHLDKLGSVRALLFGKGPSLEVAVRDALGVLGFEVAHFASGQSEFDALFEADGQRYLGEVEGKDTKAVNIEKASQLQRNILEDLGREEISEPAVGVLFGNGERMTSPELRGECFTVKVLSYAQQANIVLVRTIDLFVAAQRMRNTADTAFAARCRDAIKGSSGAVVVFPRE